jgi:hypothetical protein
MSIKDAVVKTRKVATVFIPVDDALVHQEAAQGGIILTGSTSWKI